MDDYGPPDLRQLMASRNQFCTPLQFPEQFSVHRNLTPPPPPSHYRHLPRMLGSEVVPNAGLLDNHRYTSMITTTACCPTTSSAASAALYGIEFEHGWNNIDGGNNNNNNSRWPRQETLTLLEIRSALDSKFKDTNQKGPLWDEVSRIMAEEHGFQRTGKKCKEKFENLYKYYKKTKEGKAGRQDGKHYRFFRQLEAIYGNHHQSSNQSSVHIRSNPLFCHTTLSDSINRDQIQEEVVVQDQKLISCESLSFSNNSTEFDQTSPLKNNDDDDSVSAIDYFPMNQSTGSLKNEKKSYTTPVKKKWKAKVVDFMNSQIGKVINSHEALMEKMVKSIEASADERIANEEEWRKQEAAKYEREVHEFWAKERAWVENRDAAIMEALSKYTGKGTYSNNGKDYIAKEIGSDRSKNYSRWTEHEVASLIQLKSSLDGKFQESEYLKEDGVWEEIAANMGSLGYTRSGEECKEKWENVSVCFRMTTECNKAHKQDTKTNSMYFSQISCHEEGQEVWNRRQDRMGLQLMDDGLSPSCSNMDVNSSSLHVPFNGGENLWNERYSHVTNLLCNKHLLHE